MFHRTSDIKFKSKKSELELEINEIWECMLEISRLPDAYSHWCQPVSKGFSSWKVRLKSRLCGCSNTHMNFEFSIKHWLTCDFVLSFKCTARISEWFNKRPIEWNFTPQMFVDFPCVHHAWYHFYKLLGWAATFIETTNEHKV